MNEYMKYFFFFFKYIICYEIKLIFYFFIKE